MMWFLFLFILGVLWGCFVGSTARGMTGSAREGTLNGGFMVSAFTGLLSGFMLTFLLPTLSPGTTVLAGWLVTVSSYAVAAYLGSRR